MESIPPASAAAIKRIEEHLNRNPFRSGQVAGVTFEAPETLSTLIHKKILLKLRQNHVRTSHMVIDRFKYLLPSEQASPEQASIYEDLLVAAPVVTNEQLAKIIDLELSTPTAPLGNPNQHHFYIRSWKLSLIQVANLIEFMSEDGQEHPELTRWRYILQLAVEKRPGLQHLTIRYVGTFRGQKRAIDRQEDFTRRESGILSEFLLTWSEHNPFILNSMEVHTIKGASLPWIEQANAEDTERYLFAFFDHSSLLNRQTGAFLTSYVPSVEDAKNFRRMQTNLFFTLADEATHDSLMESKIEAHFKEVQEWTNDNPKLTGCGKRDIFSYAFMDGLCEAITHQAIPPQYRKHTIFLILGRNIIHRDYVASAAFMESHGPSSILTKDFLRRLTRNEFEGNNAEWDENRFTTRPFPFVNLWHSLWHKDLLKTIRHLQQYLRIVRPLVVVSFSTDVNKIIKSNFRHEFGVPYGAIFLLSGIPSIQHYDSEYQEQYDANFQEKLRDDDAFINIPSLDPGWVTYGVQEVEFRRVLDLTWQVAFIVAYEAVKVVKDLTERQESYSRVEICAEILKRFEALKRTGYCARIVTNLAEAKQTLLAMRRKDRVSINRRKSRIKPSILTDDPEEILLSTRDLPLLDQEGCQKIAIVGRILGSPRSEIRHQQLEDLWEKNLSSLHILIPHFPTRKDKWLAQFIDLDENEYLLFHVLCNLGELDNNAYIHQLLKRFIPEECPQGLINNRQWVDVTEHKLKAMQAAHKYIECRSGVLSRQQTGGSDRKALKIEQMEGCEVTFTNLGICKILWNRGKDDVPFLKLYCSAAIVQSAEENRYLLFTKHGIDVRDRAGNLFRRGSTLASIPRVLFRSMEAGELVDELWMAVRAHRGHAVQPIVDNDGRTDKGSKRVKFSSNV